MIRFTLDGRRYAVRWLYPDKKRMSNPRLHPRTCCLWLLGRIASPSLPWLPYYRATVRCYRKTDAWDKEVGRKQALRKVLHEVVLQGRYLTEAERNIVWDAYFRRKEVPCGAET